MQKEPERLRSTSNNNQSPPAATATTSNKKDDDFNFSTQSKYKKFTDFLKESDKETKQRRLNMKSKILECNCWVCKILDSTTTSVTNNEIDTITTATKRYEPYNIVSDTGDSIFYDPLLFNIFDNEKNKLVGEIYIAEDNIRDIIQQDKLTKHFNGVNFNKIEY
jgi:hypothetical protein